jgi:hypothetical protein
VKSGARTPVAGIVHAVTLFVIILLAAPQNWRNFLRDQILNGTLPLPLDPQKLHHG